MSQDQAFAQRVVDHMVANDAYSQWLGIEVEAVDQAYARVRMTVRADMLNGFKVCHGGVTFSLADSALAFASNTHGNVTVSIENAISYPHKIVEGDVLIAEAKELSHSGRIANFDVPVKRADGTAVAHFRGTVYRTKRPHFED